MMREKMNCSQIFFWRKKMPSNNSFNEERFVAVLEEAINKVKTEEDPVLLTEMKKLFESNHFETNCIRSVRGFGYEKEDMIYQVKDAAVFAEIMKAIDKTAEEPAIVEMCGHAVYIGRKR